MSFFIWGSVCWFIYRASSFEKKCYVWQLNKHTSDYSVTLFSRLKKKINSVEALSSGLQAAKRSAQRRKSRRFAKEKALALARSNGQRTHRSNSESVLLLAHSRIFFFSQPSTVLTHSSPGLLQSLDINGITAIVGLVFFLLQLRLLFD